MDGIGQTGFTQFSYVPHRGRPHPQPASIQLAPLRKEYAFAHWKLITTNDIFDSDQETYYTITQGHPRSNVLLARRLENEPGKSLNDLRSAIARDLATGMLDDALVGHPDEAKLRTIVQLVAPLRTFDRVTAAAILEQNWPAESFQDRQIQLNNYLVSLIKLGILSRDEFVYHLDPLLRHFVIEDLRYNNRDTYVEICTTARHLSAQSFQELLKNLTEHQPTASAPMLSGLCRDILNLVYYDAEVGRWQKQRSDPAAFINNLSSQFRDYLLEWEAVAYPDIYHETTITLEELLRQDEDILKLSGRRGRDALLRVLSQLRKPA
jgi:hypothetical protein